MMQKRLGNCKWGSKQNYEKTSVSRTVINTKLVFSPDDLVNEYNVYHIGSSRNDVLKNKLADSIPVAQHFNQNLNIFNI